MTMKGLADQLRAHLVAFSVDPDSLQEFVQRECAVPVDFDVPRWLHLCRFLADNDVVEPDLLRSLIEAPEPLRSRIDEQSWFKKPASLPTHIERLRVAELAALSKSCKAIQPPASCAEQLVLRWLQKQWTEKPVMSMSVLLVGTCRGDDPMGQAAKVDYWVVDPPLANQDGKTTGTHLIRAPAFSLTQADGAFEQSLDQVNHLLAHLLQSSAPRIAFSVRTEASPAQLSALPLTVITGDSLTVALAVGCLWLLQEHLRADLPDHAVLAEALCELRPERVVATAALSTVLPPGDPGWAWPSLCQIGGFTHKLALAHGWPEFVRRHLRLYTVDDQPTPFAQVHDASTPPKGSLLGLLLRMATECGRGLTGPQRLAYRQLIDGKEPSSLAWAATITPTGQALAAQPGVEAWLLQRLGRLCGGHIDLPIAQRRHPTPDQLGPLYLQRRDGLGTGVALRLAQWLRDSAEQADAFLVTGPALSGKSTLLAQWENETARQALRCLHDRPGSPGPMGGDAVEVCIPLDVRALLRFPGEAVSRASVVRITCRHLATLAPWLDTAEGLQASTPRICAPESGRPAVWAQGVRRHHVRIRLWIDGIDLLPAAACQALAAWLFRQDRDDLLPPVFAARDPGVVHHLVLTQAGGRSRLAWAGLLEWGPADWLGFVGRPGETAPAGLDAVQQANLAKRLGYLAPDGAGSTGFQQLCQLPGQLSGVCALLQANGAAPIPHTPGRLLLALLWRQMVLAAGEAANALPDRVIWGRAALPGALDEAATLGWPAEPVVQSAIGWLLMHLAGRCAPDEAVDVAGLQLSDWMPPRGWAGRINSSIVLKAAQLAGLVSVHDDGSRRVHFTTPAWHALFLALARQHGRVNQPLELDESPLDLRRPALLASPLARLFPAADLRLPDLTPQEQEARLAADVASDPALWVEKWIAVNLPLAAQVAMDHRSSLDPHHPLLEDLRGRLLWRSFNAGSGAWAQAGVFGWHARLPGDLRDLANALGGAVPAVDVARRLQAGLLLGRLGDTIRYELSDPQGPAPRLPRLRGPLWRPIADTNVRMAALMVTQGEWDGFLASGDAWDPQAACWQQAGPAAAAWLRAQLLLHAPPVVPGMGRDRWRGAWANPLLPVTGISLHAVRAYVAWLRAHGVYAHLGLGQPDLPTEWEWHLAAQWLPVHEGDDHDRFNHAGLRWRRPSPVGVFAADGSSDGVADLRGNVRQWCGSALDRLQVYAPCSADNATRPARNAESAAVRGSSHLQPLELSDAGSRQCAAPSHSAGDLGCRLVLRPA